MPLRCAVAGLNRGKLFVEFLKNNPHCEVVAVCDAQPEKLAEVSGPATFSDFDEMLEQSRPDVVAIITPGPMHAPQSIAALEAGVNVLVETPNVYSREQAEAVVTTARERGLKYMLAEDYIYMGWCQRMAQIVESGRLGTILGAMGEYTHDCRGFVLVDESGQSVPIERAGEPGVTARWRLTDLPPLSYSSHTLGPLLSLMDDRCVTVSAFCGGRKQMGEFDVFPLEMAVLQTEKGATVNLTNGFMLGHPMGFSFALYGTEGAARVVHFGKPTLYVATDAEGKQWQESELPWADRDDGKHHVQLMVDDYVDSVMNGTALPFDEARSMDFCLPGVLAHESAKANGEKLEIPLF